MCVWFEEEEDSIKISIKIWCSFRLMFVKLWNFFKSALNSLFGALKFVFNNRGFFSCLPFQNAILNKLLFNNNGFYVKIYIFRDVVFLSFFHVWCFVFKWHSKISNYFYGIINLNVGEKFVTIYESNWTLLVHQKVWKYLLSGPWIDWKEWIIWCSYRRCVCFIFRFNLRLFHITMINTFMVTQAI